MAVNVGQRNVPDTPANRQLDACQKALDLALHTIKICSNGKVFAPEYWDAITSDIIKCAKNIYVYAWNANNTYVTQKDASKWPQREKLQLAAISSCSELLGMINIAKRLFHLRGRKSRYWSEMAIECRKLLRKWHETNKETYGK